MSTAPAVLIESLLRTVSDRVMASPEEHQIRAQEIGEMVGGLAPRDGLERMLVRLIIMHYHVIEDTARDAVHAATETLRARARSAMAALDRQMNRFLSQMARACKRVLDQAWPDDAPSDHAPSDHTLASMPAAAPATLDLFAQLEKLTGPASGLNRAARRAAASRLARLRRSFAHTAAMPA